MSLFEYIAKGLTKQVEESIVLHDLSLIDSKTGHTPLTYAVTRKKTTILKLLLLCGADVYLPNKFGDTAMVIAVSLGLMEHINILLEYGASPIENASTMRNKASLLHVALQISSRVEHGISTAKTKCHPSSTRIIIRDNEAAILKIVQTLIEFGADIKSVTEAVAFSQCKITEYLLQQGADPNADLSGRGPKMTPLMYAAIMNPQKHKSLCDLIDTLILHGGEVTSKSMTGHTAFDYARSVKNLEAMKIIWKYLPLRERYFRSIYQGYPFMISDQELHMVLLESIDEQMGLSLDELPAYLVCEVNSNSHTSCSNCIIL